MSHRVSASADVAGYVARRSIAEAQRMMRDTNESLGQIVVACGPSDRPHFTQVFPSMRDGALKRGTAPDAETGRSKGRVAIDRIGARTN